MARGEMEILVDGRAGTRRRHGANQRQQTVDEWQNGEMVPAGEAVGGRRYGELRVAM